MHILNKVVVPVNNPIPTHLDVVLAISAKL